MKKSLKTDGSSFDSNLNMKIQFRYMYYLRSRIFIIFRSLKMGLRAKVIILTAFFCNTINVLYCMHHSPPHN